MKTIKIFGLPSHQTKERTSGVDFARIIQPLKALNGYQDEDVKFEVTMFDINEKTDWLSVAKEYDIIYFNYIANSWAFAAMGAMARAHGTKIVMDLDDSLWNIKSDNPAHAVYHKGSEALRHFTLICKEVDAITTTNSYLKHVIMNNTARKAQDISVFPNYIDLENVYTHQSPFKDEPFNIQLMHFGSTTHFNDLLDPEFEKGMDKILSEYPNVYIRMVGALLPKYKNKWGVRCENKFGHEDIYKWVEGRFREYMDQADIMVTPLSEDIYNKCKSSIKWLEASSAKKPGVWKRIRQYEEAIEDGKTGFLASTDKEWYRSIKALIDDKQLRKQMGEDAYKEVKENWTIQGHVVDYAEFFKSLLDS